jgi:hypothetical protein
VTREYRVEFRCALVGSVRADSSEEAEELAREIADTIAWVGNMDWEFDARDCSVQSDDDDEGADPGPSELVMGFLGTHPDRGLDEYTDLLEAYINENYRPDTRVHFVFALSEDDSDDFTDMMTQLINMAGRSMIHATLFVDYQPTNLLRPAGDPPPHTRTIIKVRRVNDVVERMAETLATADSAVLMLLWDRQIDHHLVPVIERFKSIKMVDFRDLSSAQ